jgi:hypothetical protein
MRIVIDKEMERDDEKKFLPCLLALALEVAPSRWPKPVRYYPDPAQTPWPQLPSQYSESMNVQVGHLPFLRVEKRRRFFKFRRWAGIGGRLSSVPDR